MIHRTIKSELASFSRASNPIRYFFMVGFKQGRGLELSTGALPKGKAKDQVTFTVFNNPLNASSTLRVRAATAKLYLIVHAAQNKNVAKIESTLKSIGMDHEKRCEMKHRNVWFRVEISYRVRWTHSIFSWELLSQRVVNIVYVNSHFPLAEKPSWTKLESNRALK